MEEQVIQNNIISKMQYFSVFSENNIQIICYKKLNNK